jgi:hypothetical protein
MPDALGDFAAIQVGNGAMTWLFGGTNRNMGLSILFIIFVALLIIAHIILRYTKYGRMIQASGISANSAYMAGVNVTRVKWITLIFVSHNMADIADMCDRVIVMSEGRIALDGTTREVFSDRERLSEMGLSVPPAREITDGIAAKSPGFRSEALTIDEAAKDIRKYMEEARG